MYTPDAFTETDPAVIDAMIVAARLGLLVTHGPDGLRATHLPFLYEPATRTLIGHIARANPHSQMAGDGEALVVLSGPDAYVSPRWYRSTAADGRHVPTWNYEAVHLYGRLTWFEDREALRAVVRRLTEAHEAHIVPPWSVEEADPGYLERLLGAITGVRLEISRVEAKRKLSQNRSGEDRAAVIAALEASDDPRDREVATRMRLLSS
jgi:transcriptional regulator